MLKDLLKKNRSCRGYDESRRITRQELEEFVDCTRFAPSSLNMQPLKYFLAWDKETVEKIQPLTGWAKGLVDQTLPHPGCCPTAFIVICQDTALCESIPRFQRDVGIAAHTMLLAATEKGLGGCMIGSYDAGKVKAVLNLPDQMAPVLVVAFGKPNEKVQLTEMKMGDSTQYYRDENDVHYVPKRSLNKILINN